MILGGAIALILLLGVVISLLYKRSTKDLAYVRTGYGGEKIILNNGAFVLPILHKVTPVSLSTKCIEVQQTEENALITKDCLRADVIVNFYIKVAVDESTISTVSETLGPQTLDVSKLKQIFRGILVDAMRSAATEFTLEEIQQNQRSYIAQVEKLAAECLTKNGLSLETVSLTSIDQSDKSYFNPDNLFDAEGLTKLTGVTAAETKHCKELEHQLTIEVKQKELECERMIEEMEMQKISQKLVNQREVAQLQAQQEIDKAKATEKQKLESEQAKILTAQNIELAKQQMEIKTAEKAKEQAKRHVEASAAKAEIARAEEEVVTARELAIAERQKQIDLVEASTQAERKTLTIKANAAAERAAAVDLAEASRIRAQANAESNRILANGKRESEKLEKESLETIYKIHCYGIQQLIEAFNTLSKEKIPLEMRLDILNHLPSIPSNTHSFSENQSNNDLVFEVDEKQDNDRKDKNNLEIALNNREGSDAKSSKIRNILNDAHKSVLSEAVSTLNEMSGGAVGSGSLDR